MKKRMYVALLTALCLLALCAACGDSKQPSSDDITPPDTPADHMQEMFAPYTINIPSQPDDSTKQANRDTARAYAAFMRTHGITAFDLHNDKIVTFSDIKAPVGDDNFSAFSIVDFGLDGSLEIVGFYENRMLGNAVIFCENGTIYVEYTTYDEMLNLKYNGLCYNRGFQNDGSYDLLTFSADGGKQKRTLASHGYDANTGADVYYIHAVFQDGEYMDIEKTQVSKEVFDGYISGITALPNVQPVHYTIEKVKAALGYNGSDLLAPDLTPPKGPLPGEYIPDDETMDANKGILWMYYDFIHNNRKAYHLYKGIDVTFDELMAQSKAADPADLSLVEYGIADYGANGILELVIQDQNRNLPYYIVLFYNYGKLYIDTVTYRAMDNNAFGYSCSGGGSTFHYYIRTFSPENGEQSTKIAMIQESPYPDSGYNYEVYYELLKNGRLLELRTHAVAEEQFDEYMDKYYASQDIGWKKLEPVAKGEITAGEFSGIVIPEVVRSEAYDTRVTADELVLPNGVRLGMTYEEFVAYSGYMGEKPIRTNNYDGTASFSIVVDNVYYNFYRDYARDTDFALNSIHIPSNANDVDIFRNIKIGDSIDSVFSKIPAMDTELKEWMEQYLYGYEKTDPRGYAELNFVLSQWESNYLIKFYTPEWVVTVRFSRYYLTVSEINIQVSR